MRKNTTKLLICIILSNLCAFGQAPTITSFSPISGTVGTLVTINGTNLNAPTIFSIGNTSAVLVSNNDSTLVGMVMSGASSGAVSVVTKDGSVAASGNFTVVPSSYPGLLQGSKLVGTNAGGWAWQGFSVALSADGNTAVMGAPEDNSSTGSAIIFTRNGGIWTQQAKLKGTEIANFNHKGSSAAISADGNTVILGAQTDSSFKGAAWVFTRNAGNWNQQGIKLIGSGSVGTAEQGTAVALSADGNTAIIGGEGDSNSTGAFWIFNRNGGIWTQQGKKFLGNDIVGGGAHQGHSLSMSADGNTALVGGFGDNSGEGAAWIYTRDSTGTWTQKGNKLVGTGAAGPAFQGYSVSLSADGGTAMIGGTNDNLNEGAFWVFKRSGETWSQQGNKVKATDGIAANQGSSVSLSADGKAAIVGGFNDNANIGAAWVFTQNDGIWTQQGTKMVGAGAVGNKVYLGASVAISADASTAIVGGYGDSNSIGAGWIYISCPNTLNLSSGVLSEHQTLCVNTSIKDIRYTTVGASSASITGLPDGVSGKWASNTVSITGIPNVSGEFNYTISIDNGCGTQFIKNGILNVTPANTIILSSGAGTDSQSICSNSAIANITYNTTNATGVNVTGLPSGLSSSWSNNIATISGKPTSAGTFNFIATTTGGCAAMATKTGKINIGICTADMPLESQATVVKIFPNPANENITIQINNLLEQPVFYLYNMFGQIVQIAPLNNKETILQYHEIPFGVYSYRILNDSKQITFGKLVVN